MKEEESSIFIEGWNNCVEGLENLIEDAFLNPPKDKPIFEHIKEIVENHKISSKEDSLEPEELSPIIKDEMIMDVNSQISVSLFPPDEGQPEIDIIKLSLKQIEGIVSILFFTPCEAIEVSQALMSIVQLYLYNQEQYREDILGKKLKLSKSRFDKIIPNASAPNAISLFKISLSDNPGVENLIVNICKHFSIPYKIDEGKERTIVLGDQE